MLQKESIAMKFFRTVGLRKISWSLRRLHVPTGKNALVLDIGSGGNPYPRANVLLDAYEDTIERFHAPLVKDRPLVLGRAERLPFKDNSFDFVIASHILEHMPDPKKFLREIHRVGKAGYIETPEAFFERICPFVFHRLEVTDDAGKLIITKKTSWCPDRNIVGLYQKKFNKYPAWSKYLRKHPDPFYTRFYWENTVDFTVTNPEVSADWEIPKEGSVSNVSLLRQILISFFRWLFSQRKRNRRIDLFELLRCPECFNENLKRKEHQLFCDKCKSSYSVKNGTPFMYPSKQSVSGENNA